MTGLVLKLSPGERILINGAVVENCDRKARIAIMSPNVRVLRLRDAIHPEDAATPVSRVCYICQLLITGDADELQAKEQALRGIEQLSRALGDVDSHRALEHAAKALVQGQHYQAMKWLRSLLPMEARLLARHQQ